MKKIRTQMFRLGILICKLFSNLIYFWIKILCLSRNKVVMLSRQSNEISLDFELLNNKILQRTKNVEIKILCKTLKKDMKGKINYGFYILKSMYHISTAKVCILDGYSVPISILKHKKDLKIIQIWHASGAIKKFGYQALNKKEGRDTDIAKIMNMHKNYNYVMAPSNTTAEFYKEAFQIEKNKIFINGLPRLDYLLNNELGKEKITEFYKEYPKFKNKKTILYVPTFRQDIDSTNILKGLVQSINFSKYNLIIKLHKLDKTSINEYLVDKKYNTFDLLKIADYIITDYSAVAFEASILKKPIYFYVYDIKNYEQTRGLNINLMQEINNNSSTNIKEIIQAIENNKYDFEQLETFRIKYMGANLYNNTEKLVDFILKYLDKEVEGEKIKDNIDEYSKEKLNI